MTILPRKAAFLTVASVLLVLGCGQPQDASQTSSTQAAKEAASAFDALKKAAESGDAKAQYDLAMKLDNGEGIETDKVAAFKWYVKSAKSGNINAMAVVVNVVVKNFYKYKSSFKIDEETLRNWAKTAAEAGNADMQLKLAGLKGNVFKGRTSIYGDSASEQNANADVYFDWLNKATTQGNPEAKYMVGMAYLLGVDNSSEMDMDKIFERPIRPAKTFVTADPEKGLKLLVESADQGYWNAQWATAIIYQTGLGKIAKNFELSNEYWSKLDLQTDPNVQWDIAVVYAESSPQFYKSGKNKYRGKSLSYDETNKLAAAWYKKSADQGEVNSMYELAKMTQEGRGLYKSEKDAVDLFKKAAEQDHPGAQAALGFAYLEGKGVVKDYEEARKHLTLVASGEDQDGYFSEARKAQNALGVLFEYGWGTDNDLVLAYAWYNIAASGGHDKAKQNLARVEKAIKPEELREAQTLSREWKPGQPMVRSGSTPSGISGASTGTSSSSGKSLKLAAVGTGFFVSSNGNVITNNHVVEGCGEIRIPADNTTGKLVVTDPANDLALIKLEVTGKSSVQFPATDDLKQGEEVFAFGFPLDGYLPSAGNITTGIVSALAGPGNNSSLIQTTAPVQPGNSGGPLLNKKGKVVGVVVGKANAIRIAKVTGDIPQNINFAIAPRTVKSFLDGNRVEYQKKGDIFSFDKDSVAIADEARKASMKIECWR